MFRDFIDMKQAAELTGYSINTLYKKVERGQIPFRKLGRRNIFLKGELLHWMGGSSDQRQSGGGRLAAGLHDSLVSLKGQVEGLEAGGGLSESGARRLIESIDICLGKASMLLESRQDKENVERKP